LIDFTPEMRAEALERVKRYEWAPTPYVPSVAGNPQSGSPMTDRVDGKQYIVVAVSGGNDSGEYLAFSLPE
jgi:hypothetical protein